MTREAHAWPHARERLVSALQQDDFLIQGLRFKSTLSFLPFSFSTADGGMGRRAAAEGSAIRSSRN